MGIRETVRSWYTSPWPEMGYDAIERPYGVCQVYPDGGGVVHLRTDVPPDLDAIRKDLPSLYGARGVPLGIDDRDADARFGPDLVAAGYTPDTGNVMHAWDGRELFDVPEIPGLRIEVADDTTIREFSVVKLQGFGDTEDEPAPADLEREMTFRRAEMRDTGRFLVARLDGEAVAICGTFDGDDGIDISLLATRVPFRHRRVGRTLLRHVLAGAGDRFVVIGADEQGRPVQLYRSLGFTQEVYWRRRYTPS